MALSKMPKDKSGNAAVGKSGASDAPVVVLNKSKMFDQSASLTDIFGAQMTPGLGLVDEIIKAYKVHYFISFHLWNLWNLWDGHNWLSNRRNTKVTKPSTHMICVVSSMKKRLQVPTIRKVQFFASDVDTDASQRMILRHPSNGRRQDQVLNEYVKSVQMRGIVPGVRGQAWLLAPDGEKNQHAYLALTFATLCPGAKSSRKTPPLTTTNNNNNKAVSATTTHPASQGQRRFTKRGGVRTGPHIRTWL